MIKYTVPVKIKRERERGSNKDRSTQYPGTFLVQSTYFQKVYTCTEGPVPDQMPLNPKNKYMVESVNRVLLDVLFNSYATN